MTRSLSRIVIVMFAGSLGLSACSRGMSTPEQAARAEGSRTPISMAVTVDGFVPSKTRVKVGEPVTLVVTRKIERTCATDIVIKEFGVNSALPRDKPVEVTFTPTKAGPIHYSCAMGMVFGELVAE
jgi:plastocyanin domain-containing protein